MLRIVKVAKFALLLISSFMFLSSIFEQVARTSFENLVFERLYSTIS
jgi:hypothetical protein